MKATLVAFGGARNPTGGKFGDGVSKAARIGLNTLVRTGSVLDAVEEAIKTCEDASLFNAGSGAHLNLDGEAEMDAIIMDGKTLGSGAVAAVKHIKNPISVARKVMEETDCVLLGGEGTVKFARVYGFEQYLRKNEERLKQWKKLRKMVEEDQTLPGVHMPNVQKLRKYLRMKSTEGTVGAVGIDRDGNIAAGASTGGPPMRLPGRVSDIPLLGCSVYAKNDAGGVALTGSGNIMIRYGVARKVCELMERETSAQKAVESVVTTLNEMFEDLVLGIVAIDKQGKIGAARNLDGMPHSYMTEGMQEPKINFAPIISKKPPS